MSTAFFVIILIIGMVLAWKFGRTLTAMILACLLGVAIAGSPLGAPARAAMDGIRAGLTAAADAAFSGNHQ